ncbi:MAG: hypothetical protein HYV18_00125 [Gammaproteobacteria bacterium]|nr:hypothetical protein [Gammaproteobacteria bacterium]
MLDTLRSLWVRDDPVARSLRRMQISVGYGWHRFQPRPPGEGVVIGTVCDGVHDGALVFLRRSGVYVMMNHGQVRGLDQEMVSSALEIAGVRRSAA